MSGNYPPGVTGTEKEIVGRPEVEWDKDTFESTGVLSPYTLEGFVVGFTKTERFTAYATKCCGEIEIHEDTAEFDGVLEEG